MPYIIFYYICILATHIGHNMHNHNILYIVTHAIMCTEALLAKLEVVFIGFTTVANPGCKNYVKT